MLGEEDLQKPVGVVLEVLAVLVSLLGHHAPVDERAQLLPLLLLPPLSSQYLACPGQHLLDLVLETHDWSGSFSGSCRVDPQGEDASARCLMRRP